MKENQEKDILDEITVPADLRKLPVESLPEVCASLRRRIIETCSSHPGHFASSMGAVELTVALHYVFSTPDDRIVWDVGHQAYAHKLLTGRKDRFDTLRCKGGLSGFPTPRESEYDTFTAGHASNSISAALGMASAASLTPGQGQRKTVAVIGDASISGGLAFEGLNNAANTDNNLLIVLNDNDMSIDKNVGSLHRYLSRLTTSNRYNRLRRRTYNFMRRHKMIKDRDRGRLTRFNNSLKSLFSGRQNIFEGLNIRYFGPVDGHDVKALVKTLREISAIEGPRILHLTTRKGKGFAPAEESPSIWHAPGKFDPDTGERIKGRSAMKWQNAMATTLVDMAGRHPEIVGITAAMPSGTSMDMMQHKFPERTFDVGISEGHAVTFAGGLAVSGKHPFVAIYSSFLQRAYDNIIHDTAIWPLPVTYCIDRAGLVGEDGITHHGLFDMAYLSVIPGMRIASPMDTASLQGLMTASLGIDGPMAIRYPRGTVPEESGELLTGRDAEPLPEGKGRRLTGDGTEPLALLSIGPIGHEGAKAVARLREEGVAVSHYDMIWLRPLDEKLLRDVLRHARGIVTLEDASVKGGLGSAVLEFAAGEGSGARVRRIGVPADRWIPHATVAEQWKECGMDADSIAATLRSLAAEISGAADSNLTNRPER